MNAPLHALALKVEAERSTFARYLRREERAQCKHCGAVYDPEDLPENSAIECPVVISL